MQERPRAEGFGREERAKLSTSGSSPLRRLSCRIESIGTGGTRSILMEVVSACLFTDEQQMRWLGEQLHRAGQAHSSNRAAGKRAILPTSILRGSSHQFQIRLG